MSAVKPQKPGRLLLTNHITYVPENLPMGIPHYNGRHSIGIMWERHNGRKRWCFVNRATGRPLFKKWYDAVRHFKNGYAAVCERGKWHFITEAGKIACPHRFEAVCDIHEDGSASVQHAGTFYNIRTRQPDWIYYHLPTRTIGYEI